MLFTIENEKRNRMYFVDVQIIRDDKTFTTSINRKTTFIEVYKDFYSFVPST